MNPDEFNYRILKGKISELIAGTPCECDSDQNTIDNNQSYSQGEELRLHGHGDEYRPFGHGKGYKI